MCDLVITNDGLFPTTITNAKTNCSPTANLSANLSSNNNQIMFQYTGQGASTNIALNTVYINYSALRPLLPFQPVPYATMINNGGDKWFYGCSFNGYNNFVGNYHSSGRQPVLAIGILNNNTKTSSPNPITQFEISQFGMRIYSNIDGSIIMVYTNVFNFFSTVDLYVIFLEMSYNKDGTFYNYSYIRKVYLTGATNIIDQFSGAISMDGDIGVGAYVSNGSMVMSVWNGNVDLVPQVNLVFKIITTALVASDYSINNIVTSIPLINNYIQLFNYDSVKNTINEGQKLIPSTGYVNTGYALAMSGDGNTLVFTSMISESTTTFHADLLIYKKNNNEWTQFPTIPFIGGFNTENLSSQFLAMGSNNLAIYSNDSITNNIILYDTNNSTIITETTVDLPITYLSISNDNTILSVGSNNNILKFTITSTDLIPGVAARSGKLLYPTITADGGTIVGQPGDTDSSINLIISKSPTNMFSLTFSDDFSMLTRALSTYSTVPDTSTDPPQISISVQLNEVTKDVVEVVYKVTSGLLYYDGLGQYCGTVMNVDAITQFQVLFLEVNCAVIGVGSLFDKILNFNSNNNDEVDGLGFTGYILLKILLGRLLYNEFNLKWAYRCNYARLYAATSASIYSDSIPTLKVNSSYEELLKWSCD